MPPNVIQEAGENRGKILKRFHFVKIDSFSNCNFTIQGFLAIRIESFIGSFLSTNTAIIQVWRGPEPRELLHSQRK